MHMSYCNNTSKHIFMAFRVWLMKHSLITCTSCTRLVCIYTWDNKDLIFDLLLHACKTVHIVNNRFLIIS